MVRQEWSVFCHVVLLLLSVSGLIGAVLISDEFDSVRNPYLGFVALPVLIGYCYLYLEDPQLLRRFAKLRGLAVVAVLAGMLWGNILWLNAVGDGQVPVQVAMPLGTQVAPVAHWQGPLGMIYRFRF